MVEVSSSDAIAHIVLSVVEIILDKLMRQETLTYGVIFTCVMWYWWLKHKKGRRVSPPYTYAIKKGGSLNVVITGSTKGIGYALAVEFLKQGDNVVIVGRSSKSVEKACQQLKDALHIATMSLDECDGSKSISSVALGWPCDVTNAEDCEGLASAVKSNLGRIDLWINNAGCSQIENCCLENTPPDEMERIVRTNTLGTLFGTRAALRIMKQQDFGHIFNMDGAGSSQWGTPSFATYGMTKAGFPQFMKSLLKETKGTNVGVHTCSPGMVITDLLMSGSKGKGTLRIFNILAEQPDVVATWLVPRMRTVQHTGSYYRYLTKTGVFLRFLTFWRYRNKHFKI